MSASRTLQEPDFKIKPRVHPVPKKRKPVLGLIIGVASPVLAFILSLAAWNFNEQHPRTDDAVVRANLIGIAPRVSGPIIKVCMRDNQFVKSGDLLFEIDPADFKTALDSARASVSNLQANLLQKRQDFDRETELFQRRVDSKQQFQDAQNAFTGAQAQLDSARANLQQANLNLGYTKVFAPFDGEVVSLNISEGYYATAGTTVFDFLDARKWYVLANFRERELKSIRPGMTAEVYLWSNPDRRFEGIVEGISPAAVSPDDNSQVSGVPSIQRDLNWVRIAQRFPVRILMENPDPRVFRMGTTAVTTIKGFTRTAGRN
ncbi:MAG TPA: HlyD family secretion protein [Chthoniobacterales bacterium]|jgi:membrane fusion protein, multidrug efflux system|nr:HlyD family secretion protein [Chthoniobacterales bacterium]